MTIKLIIWDLDDTLWEGTLADGDAVRLHDHRAAMIRQFNAQGVVSSICSKNDPEVAKARLVELGLWDEFVFPRIAFAPKAQAIAGIIEDMQLRPANVLFVDDNPVNLADAKHRLPKINLLDIRDEGADAFLTELLERQPPSRNRVAEYRMLESRKRDRTGTPALSNEEFLRTCGIRATAPFCMDNLDFLDRIVELINRSNQLNYTGSRVERETLKRDIIDVARHDSWAIFAWDKYGDYGLIGFVMWHRLDRKLTHFTFSCRVMHMGLEEYALEKVRGKFAAADTSQWDGRFSRVRPDWIEDVPFNDPDVRPRLVGGAGREIPAAPALRLAIDCQSGGVAHFSRWLDRIEFDNAPRVFGLKMVIDGSHEAQHWPPFLVYGAGIDYTDPRWEGLEDLLEDGLYEACVGLFHDFIESRGIETLIVLPPENAPPEKYRPHMRHTRKRTIAFNARWRAAAGTSERITLLEMSDIIAGDEMADVSHFYAGFLQKLAGHIDGWFEQASGRAEPRRAVA